MPPQAFDALLGLLTERIAKKDTNYRKAISAADRLALTLRFLAAGLTLRMVTFNFLVGRSTACRMVSDVCDALWDILQPVYLTIPQTADEWLRVAADFEERWNFPHCLGAIDGKHVTVECPPKSGSLDRNYKGTFSKSMLAVSGAHYRFLYVELGHHGSECDGGIFSRCKLQERLLQGQMGMPPDQNVGIEGPLPYFFVGDEAFPLKTCMMRPFCKKRQFLHEQRIFNYRLSRARRVVENAFGILAQKWRSCDVRSRQTTKTLTGLLRHALYSIILC
ncbi:unnamed protein product [Ixodes pacificus]